MRGFSRILCILILGILFIGCSPKSKSSIDEGTERMKLTTNYKVEDFKVVDSNKKIVQIYFDQKDIASIEVNFDKVDIDGYYCIVGNGVGNENNLSGTRQIETNDGKKIRLSNDLEKEIMKELQ